ncbi:DUF305 domain-containing protein [Streptomyces sp. NPDC056411]|uniref:DUF305 domain-containing protein n=1 Tax=Streptomyces sp. NPDC056411 TaxID=3345813 RepID=UPI0035E356CE
MHASRTRTRTRTRIRTRAARAFPSARPARTAFPRRAVLAAALTAVALTLTACGGSGSADHASPGHGASATAGATAGKHNAADVSFAQQMIPHHRQAVAMAELAATRAGSGEVRSLAAAIKKAQGPEINTMSGWLKSWGETVPQDHGTEGMPGMEGMHHGSGAAMPGMMDDQEMTRLKNASGKAFDTQFLTLMIKHHEGAVTMAAAEQKRGAYGPAKKLAGDISTAQKAEIATMRKLAGTH